MAKGEEAGEPTGGIVVLGVGEEGGAGEPGPPGVTAEARGGVAIGGDVVAAFGVAGDAGFGLAVRFSFASIANVDSNETPSGPPGVVAEATNGPAIRLFDSDRGFVRLVVVVV